MRSVSTRLYGGFFCRPWQQSSGIAVNVEFAVQTGWGLSASTAIATWPCRFNVLRHTYRYLDLLNGYRWCMLLVCSGVSHKCQWSHCKCSVYQTPTMPYPCFRHFDVMHHSTPLWPAWDAGGRCSRRKVWMPLRPGWRRWDHCD
jgi:hypothetical protein